MQLFQVVFARRRSNALPDAVPDREQSAMTDARRRRGGPAGSTCAWRLHQAGLDVLVVDAATFPRDKVCAGWITPQVVAALRLDTEAYAASGRTFQPITGFRVGLIDGRDATCVAYDRPASFGIRRCEFDHYLLQRAGARVRLGARITSIRKDGRQWIVNDAIRAPLGRRGSGCPVARMLNGRRDRPVIVAREPRRRRSAPPSSRRSRSHLTSRSCSSAAICKAMAGACAKANTSTSASAGSTRDRCRRRPTASCHSSRRPTGSLLIFRGGGAATRMPSTRRRVAA
jgi:hypothetical protein